MKNKLCAGALALALLLSLAACQDPPEENPTPSPSPSAEVTPTPEPTPEATLPAVANDTRYFFAEGYFLGAWSDGTWHSSDTEPFTVGEVFDRDYYDVWGEALNSVRFYAGEGPGEFEDPKKAAQLLEPFGILEGTDFIMKLPGQLSGEAAQLYLPNYNFYVSFEGQPHYFVSNVAIPEPEWHMADSLLPEDMAAQALETMGITYDVAGLDRTAWVCDLDGDGVEELVERIQIPSVVGSGEKYFYAFLLMDGDRVEVIASRVNPPEFSDDVTTYFSADTPSFRDLDGDGTCEIIFQEHCWEWGQVYAYARSGDTWKQVLCANYGM